MKIGILISGRGSNMVALVDAVASGTIPNSEVVVVISDKADAAGLAKARERGAETVAIERSGRTREEHRLGPVATHISICLIIQRDGRSGGVQHRP